MKAILVDKIDDRYIADITDVPEDGLPDGNVTVAVEYSTLNYKDSLALTGASPAVRRFPMVPGVDFSGTVTESDSDRYTPGDVVVLNGWGVGETHWGGYAERARVDATGSARPRRQNASSSSGRTREEKRKKAATWIS